MTGTIDTETLTSLGLMRQSESAKKEELGQAQFMELMVAQLRNQDPFAPMESGDFLGQIAQFGTVSGIEDVREALTGLTAAMSANQTMQAAALVDRQAYVTAREAWLPPGAAIEGSVNVPVGVSDATISIYDMNGRLMTTQAVDVGGENAGKFVWDGTMADGDEAPSGYYELRASGSVGNVPTALDVLVSGRIESVSVDNPNGLIELTVTGLGTLDLTEVRKIS